MNRVTLNLFYKIKSSCPRFLLGQERIRSCGTTQIDANCVHSAHTSNNARSPDNGRSPRRSYLAEAVRLALLKSIHTVLACRNHTACGSLGGSVSLLLVFVIGLCWFTWYGHSIFAKQVSENKKRAAPTTMMRHFSLQFYSYNFILFSLGFS